jgi:anionic cell wall polymer biosynthesis LytR-Cps2A-Psr (LCP) family protein
LRRRSATALALLVAFVLSGAFNDVLAATRLGGGVNWGDVSRWLATAGPVGPVLRLLDGRNAVSTGSDGRLTILLLGSDTRGSAIGRTDSIMVMSIRDGTISALSIPRDSSQIPDPFDGGIFHSRVNAILEHLAAGRTNEQALSMFKAVIENLLGIEIDYYALLDFPGFQALVDEIQPVTVDINQPVRDTRYWDDASQPSGVYFPAATNYDLWALQPGPDPLCTGLWRFQPTPIPSSFWCRRAMPYVRSRKGSSDFQRAGRQQNFVIGAIRRVINRGSGSALGSLVSRAVAQQQAGTLTTDIPLTVGNALELYQTLSGASVGIHEVLSPPKYASHIPGTTAYELNLTAVRELTQQWFGGSGTPPVASPIVLPTGPPTSSPSATASAQPSATASPVAVVTTPTPTASVPPSAAPGSSGAAGLLGSADSGLLIVLVVIAAGVALAFFVVRRLRTTRR